MRWLLPLLFWPLLAAQAQVQSSIVSTTARGDSLFVTVAFDSVHLKTDTVFVVRVDTVYPSLPSGSPSHVLFGASQYPIDSLGPVYTVTVTQLSASTMLTDLQRIRARGGKIALTLARKPTRAWDPLATNAEGGKGDSVLSVAATEKYLATWPDSSKLNPFFRDGTILQIRTSDDIVSKSIWGTDAPNRPRLDSLGLVVKQRYPLARTSLRAHPTQMAGYKWKWTNDAWSQYAVLDRLGTAEQHLATQNASAKAQGLCLIYSINAVGYTDLSPQDVIKYAAVFGPYTPYFTYWWWDKAAETPMMKQAYAQVRSALDTTAYRGCPK